MGFLKEDYEMGYISCKDLPQGDDDSVEAPQRRGLEVLLGDGVGTRYCK